MIHQQDFLSYITFIRIRVKFEATEPILLPQYKGSAFRGCLGEALRKQVCTHLGLNCEKCNERFICPFSLLFNSFVAPDHPHHRKYPKSPHPYIIDPLPDNKTDFEPGDTFGFDLTLIGKAEKQLPLLLHVFQRMGETGIGKGRGHFKPVSYQYLDYDLKYKPLPYFGQPESISLDKIPVPSVEKQITINLENPLRLKENGKILESAPTFGFLMNRLALRIGLLAHFHCGAPWSEQETASLPVPEVIQISGSKVQMTDWQRYSGTQDTTMHFDGLVGQITYQGEGLNDWMPLLLMGSFLHAGSTATFGLGKYSLQSS
ncbi:MAG: CRISPR system precrRNA processing endoribonuclease RAMP protein Cas6 [Bacteroidales bacterium]|nr:CRISPR system precrRNA processing endoribonuclease RAMP protein Cas6 [Bacteroidales bacterium]